MIYLIFAAAFAATLLGLIQVGTILRVAFSTTTTFKTWGSLVLTIGIATACAVIAVWLWPVAIAGLFL
jgi:hypothetical protein